MQFLETHACICCNLQSGTEEKRDGSEYMNEIEGGDTNASCYPGEFIHQEASGV